MRRFGIVMILALFAIIGVGVIQAADDNTVPTFGDGRVNNWQLDEPVAVFCVFDHSEDVNVGVFQRIEVWGLSGDKLLEASAAQIDAASGCSDSRPRQTAMRSTARRRQFRSQRAGRLQLRMDARRSGLLKRNRAWTTDSHHTS